MARLRPFVLRLAAVGLDNAVLAAAARRRGKKTARPRSREERLAVLRACAEAYGDPALIRDPERFFPAPAAIAPTLREVRPLPAGGRVADASWASAFTPYLSEVRSRYFDRARNDTAYARLYLHAEPRPAAILIHGYLGGHFRWEERVWPIRWLHGRGLDVAVVQLPFHGLRMDPAHKRASGALGVDPYVTNEFFRQAIFDLRALLRWLEARGSSRVGALGMSLGGYTTSLLATIEPRLAFAVPIIPLASFADFARDRGRLGRGDAADEAHAVFERANRVVSPFSRPSLVPKERIVIVGGEHDRITPIAQAERLAAHFGVDLLRFPGSHLLQVGIRDGYRAIAAMLERNGVIGPRDARSGGAREPRSSTGIAHAVGEA